MKTIGLIGVLGLLPLLSGCGKTAAGPSSLASLPKATGEVSGGTQSSRGARARRNKDLFNATTGVVLASADSSTFSGKSRAFCETAQTTKNLLREASQNDKIACYVGAMDNAGAFTNSYDGNYHYYTLSGAGEGGSLKIKFRASKDADGVVNAFRMYTCHDSTQQEYLNTSVSGGTATLTAVGSHSHTAGPITFSGAHRVTVSGSYGASGWTGNKTIIGQGSFSAAGGITFSDSRYVEMTQSASTVTLSGSSSHSFGGNTGTALIYAVIQGLNMGDINTFALGDGTAKAQFVHNAATHNGEVSWNGDDKLNLGDVTTGDYYSTVHDAALPSATTPAPNFTSEETWDCAAEGEFETVNFATLNASPTFQSDFQACNDNFGFGGEGGGQGFIDCPHAGD